ncbi:MAG TPA: hypothetical protein PKM25_10425 [Candidatus Ozemobacteraceae bacterium]|nr:hypothetical protein [Candidatus Ozemobacteraceae bacterium]
MKYHTAATWLFIGFVFLYLFTAKAFMEKGDDVEMIGMAGNFLASGTASLKTEATSAVNRLAGGQPALDMLIVRPYWESRNNLHSFEGTKSLLKVSFLASLISAGTLFLFFLLCLNTGISPAGSFLLSAILGLTSLIWPYSQHLFADSTVGFLLLGTFLALVVFRTSGSDASLVVAGFFWGFAFFTKLVAIIAVPPLLAYLALSLKEHNHGRAILSGTNIKRLFLLFLPVVSFLILVGMYNDLRYGNPFELGYKDGRDLLFGFNNPVFTGLFGLLFSPGKGFFWYNTPCLLALWGMSRSLERRTAASLVALAISLSFLLFYSCWYCWHGDWSWGTRFLVPAIPFLLYLAAARFDEAALWHPGDRKKTIRQVILVLMLAIGFSVQLLGVAVDAPDYIIPAGQAPVFKGTWWSGKDWPIQDDLLTLHFIPEFSPLNGHLWMVRCLLNKGTPFGDQLQANPPWKCLNPLWSPEKIEDTYIRWNIWWLHALNRFPESRQSILWIAGSFLIGFLGAMIMGSVLAFGKQAEPTTVE